MTYLSYNDLLRQETDAEIITTLKRKGWVEVPAPVIPEPTEQEIYDASPPVCNAQLKLWLIDSGHLDAVRAIVNGAADATQKLKLQTEFQSRTIIRRNNPMVETVRVAMSWTHAYVNNLFREASQL